MSYYDYDAAAQEEEEHDIRRAAAPIIAAITAERDAAVADARELRAACELALDYYHLSAGEWLKKHGAGMTTRDLGDVFRAALAAKYGDGVGQ